MSVGFLCIHHTVAARTYRLLCYNKSATEHQLAFEARRHLSNNFNELKNKFSRISIVGSIVKHFGRFHFFKTECNEKLSTFGEILTQQFNFYAAQRLRRASQIWSLYTKLYTEKSVRHIVSRFVRSLRSRRSQKFTFLLGAALFSWEKEKITDQEIQRSICELDSFHSHKDACSEKQTIKDTRFVDKLREEGWEAVIQKETIQLWRKSFPHSYLYEYKIFGTFFDVPARTFFSIQTDIEYRKKWDKLVIKLDVVDQEDDSKCEVVHWVMHYPYPMYSREYVYIRRFMIDPKTNTMVLVSRAVEHPCCPESNKYVRVSNYSSKMVIRPHTAFDENGFDYILTYFDDPQAAFPSVAYNWMASCGVPDFVERLHEAARELHYQQKKNKSNSAQSVSTNQPQSATADAEYAYL